MPALLPWGVKQFCDGNGNPLVGGWVAYAQVGTGGQILRNVYGDEGETVVLSNPVPLDASGRPYSGGSQQSIWGDGSYEEYVYDSSGVLQTTAIIDTQSAPAIAGAAASPPSVEGPWPSPRIPRQHQPGIESEPNVLRQHQQLSSGLGFPLTQGGLGTTDDRGHGHVRFDTPFTSVGTIVCTPFNPEYPTVISVTQFTNTDFTVLTGPRTRFFWVALGA